MKISYIAPVQTPLEYGIVGGTVKNMMQNNIMDPMQEAISNAIQESIVIPFQTWCHNTWINFVDASFIFCLALATTGAICGILGIKKGYKATVFAIIFYVLLRFFSWAMGWY